jgi:hypothetical protein
MADRVTTVSEEAVVQGSPRARATYMAEESVVQGSPNARLTYFAVEVILPAAATPTTAQPIIWFMT